VLQRLSLDRVAHPVEVIYPASGQAYFERLRQASIYVDVVQIVPRPLDVAAGEAEIAIGESGDERLLGRALVHSVDCIGYRLQEADGRRMLPEELERAGVRGPLVGELLRRGSIEMGGRIVRLEEVSEHRAGQSFAFVMDTRPCPAAGDLARGTDLLVCEATYLAAEAQEAREHFHMTAVQAAELGRAAGARRLVLTHFSQRYDDLEAFRSETAALHPDVVVGRDLDRIPVPRRGS
jgi:ribonuclease Z